MITNILCALRTFWQISSFARIGIRRSFDTARAPMSTRLGSSATFRPSRRNQFPKLHCCCLCFRLSSTAQFPLIAFNAGIVAAAGTRAVADPVTASVTASGADFVDRHALHERPFIRLIVNFRSCGRRGFGVAKFRLDCRRSVGLVGLMLRRADVSTSKSEPLLLAAARRVRLRNGQNYLITANSDRPLSFA